jgi:hypothetical protein
MASTIRIITVLGFSLLVSSCASADSDNGGAPVKSPSIQGSAVPPDVGSHADGNVSRKEYESAFDDTVSCLRKAGFIVKGPKLDRSGFLLMYDAVSKGMPDSRVMAESQRCESTHLTVVSEKYMNGHLSEIRTAEASAERKLVACLRAKEVVVDPTDTTGAVIRLRTSQPVAIAECEG